MPSSHHYQLTPIVDLIMSLNPQSILDVGAGFGKFGVLCREYLELWDGRYQYTFKRKIDCVEAFGEYITPLHKFIYDKIYVADIAKLINELHYTYDLVLLIDVLEHFEKQQGTDLLNKLLDKNKGVLVSTPKEFFAQGPGFGNDYEIHKSHWSTQELEEFGFVRNKKKRGGTCRWAEDQRSHICYLSRSSS